MQSLKVAGGNIQSLYVHKLAACSALTQCFSSPEAGDWQQQLNTSGGVRKSTMQRMQWWSGKSLYLLSLSVIPIWGTTWRPKGDHIRSCTSSTHLNTNRSILFVKAVGAQQIKSPAKETLNHSRSLLGGNQHNIYCTLMATNTMEHLLSLWTSQSSRDAAKGEPICIQFTQNLWMLPLIPSVESLLPSHRIQRTTESLYIYL